eukprot:3233909-Pyramimonas_sp.AAC.1
MPGLQATARRTPDTSVFHEHAVDVIVERVLTASAAARPGGASASHDQWAPLLDQAAFAPPPFTKAKAEEVQARCAANTPDPHGLEEYP